MKSFDTAVGRCEVAFQAEKGSQKQTELDIKFVLA